MLSTSDNKILSEVTEVKNLRGWLHILETVLFYLMYKGILLYICES